MSVASGAFVQRHDAGAAEAEIMLQRQSRAVDLGCRGGAAQLTRQLIALREPGRAERMALRQQSAGGIGDELAAIGVVAIVDETLRATLRAKPEGFIGDQFVLGKAVAVSYTHLTLPTKRIV